MKCFLISLVISLCDQYVLNNFCRGAFLVVTHGELMQDCIKMARSLRKGSALQETVEETHSSHLLRNQAWAASVDNLLFLSIIHIRCLPSEDTVVTVIHEGHFLVYCC